MTRVCIEDGCGLQCSFGLIDKKPTHCLEHKSKEMRNVVSIKCIEDGCGLQCSFGLIDKKPTHCFKHKSKEMRNVVTIKCIVDNCTTTPAFNFKSMPARYCSKHKLKGMINAMSNRCIIKDCEKEANFNFRRLPSMYCDKHKEKDMVNVTSKRCIEKNCYTRASHNLEGQKPLYCDNHKLKNMVDVRGKRCKAENCYKQPLYNFKGKPTLYCGIHKIEKMINVKQKRCTNCDLFLVTKKNNFLCYYCQPFPRLLKKETKVKVLLEENGLKFTHNKQINNDCCLKYKPDFLFDCNTYYVVLECDENQHSGYEQECEMVRMNNISIGLGLPTLFIRYNPDLPGVKTKQKHRELLKTLDKYLGMEKLDDPTPVYLFYRDKN